MKGFQKNKICLGLVSALSVASMFGCGSGSDNGLNSESSVSPTPAPSEAKTYQITAIDGYLDDAVVCLDVNENFDCDEGSEPFANKGTGNGQYSLDVTELEGNPEDYNLIVKVIKGVTVDLDIGVPAEHDYLLTAPKGIKIVSPLTTLVEQAVRSGNTVAEAEAKVREELKLPASESLLIDFIKDDKTVLHAIASSLVQAQLMPVDSTELETLPQQKEIDQSSKITEISTAIESLQNDETSDFTMQACLDSLDDKGFERQAGDVWEWSEQRDRWFDGEGNIENNMVVTELMGNDFSWLTEMTEIHIKAPWITEKEKSLTWLKQTLFLSNSVSITNHFSDKHYYYGHEEYQAGTHKEAQDKASLGSLYANFGYVKLTPSAYSPNNTLILNVPRESGFVNTMMASIQSYQNGDTDKLFENSFTATTVFLGKETVITPAGTFQTCKIESPYKGVLNGIEQDAVETTWKNNRGTVKYSNAEPGFVYSLERVATLLPDYPRKD